MFGNAGVGLTRQILYVNTPVYTGGAEISLLALMRRLDPDRYAPMLVTSGEGPLSVAARSSAIRVISLDFPWPSRRRPWRYPASIFGLVRTIRDSRVALAHTNCDHSLRYIMYASRLSGIPYVSHVRDFVRSWFEPAKIAALNAAKAVIANSKAVAAACVSAGVRSEHLTVIYNPIEVDLFARTQCMDGGGLRRANTLPENGFLIGIAGQIQEIKGHETLVAAAPAIVNAVPNAHFVVIGEALTDGSREFKMRLQQMIAAAGLSDRFHFLGFRDDPERLFGMLDALTVPSWNEPFGRVVVEGQAAGCPVIGTRAGGIPEIITDGENGVLVEPKDSDALAAAIIRLEQNATLRDRLGRNGMQSSRRFGAVIHANRMQELYDQIISRRDGDKVS